MSDFSALFLPDDKALHAALDECNALSAPHGMTLTPQDMRMLSLRREEALSRAGRLEFDASIYRRLVYAFCDSPFLSPRLYADMLGELLELFYQLKNETGESVPDDELIQAMQESFNGRAQGDMTYLGDIVLASVCRSARGLSEDELWEGDMEP